MQNHFTDSGGSGSINIDLQVFTCDTVHVPENGHIAQNSEDFIMVPELQKNLRTIMDITIHLPRPMAIVGV